MMEKQNHKKVLKTKVNTDKPAILATQEAKIRKIPV
jgi:hypothetical protein